MMKKLRYIVLLIITSSENSVYNLGSNLINFDSKNKIKTHIGSEVCRQLSDYFLFVINK